MRNLKRVLSLTLASVMLLGMMVIGAGAAVDYPDVDDDKDNVEAIDVLSTVGIMEGYETGNFQPERQVTRAEMAAIMSRLMNLNTYVIGNNPFTDVPSWAEGYVSACYVRGIIKGYGNGKFGTDDPVTAVQAAAMLMRALGYFQYESDYADGFEVATIRQAGKIGLFDRVNTTKASDNMTRNQVAQLVLNTLQSGMVEPDSSSTMSVTTPDGFTVAQGQTTYVYMVARDNAVGRAINDTKATNGNSTSGLEGYVLDLGEQLYNGDLKLYKDRYDDFGRPSRKWEYLGETIGTYVKEELIRQEWTAKVTGENFYDLLGSDVINSNEWSFKITIDGVEVGKYTGTTSNDTVLGSDFANSYFDRTYMTKNWKTAVGGTGNGVLTQVFVDANTTPKKVDIAVINTYLAIAAADYSEKKDEVNLKVFALEDEGSGTNNKVYYKFPSACKTDGEQVSTLTVTGDDFAITDVEKDEIYLVTVANGSVMTMAVPDVIEEATLTAFSKNNYVISDSNQYDYASAIEFDVDTLESWTGEAGAVNLKNLYYNLYLDPYGYLIGVEVVEPTRNYIFLTGIDAGTSNLNNKTSEAAGILLDGTFINFSMNMIDSQKVDVDDGTGTAFYGHALWNRWCTYSVDKSGVYTLKQVGDYDDVFTAAKPAKAGQYWDNTSNNRTIDTKRISLYGDASHYVYGNDDSVYIVAELKEVKAKNKIVANSVMPGDGTPSDSGAEIIEGGDVVIISGVDSYVTGIDNVDIKTFNTYTDIPTKVSSSSTAFPGWIYTLFDDDGHVIAAVIVGEDNGSNKNLVYVNSSETKKEEYSDADEEYTWTREVIFNGEKTDITEVGNGIGKLDNMQQYVWYEVAFKADGTVRDVKYAYYTNGDAQRVGLTKATNSGPIKGPALDQSYIDSDDPGNYVNHIEFLEKTYTEGNKSTVLYEEVWGNTSGTKAGANPAADMSNGYGSSGTKGDLTVRPKLIGKSLWFDQDYKKGFRVSENVKTVFIQKNGGSWSTETWEGKSYLERALEDLHYYDEDAKTFLFKVSAVLVNNTATVVVIHDWAGGDTVKGPGAGGGSGISGIKAAVVGPDDRATGTLKIACFGVAKPKTFEDYKAIIENWALNEMKYDSVEIKNTTAGQLDITCYEDGWLRQTLTTVLSSDVVEGVRVLYYDVTTGEELATLGYEVISGDKTDGTAGADVNGTAVNASKSDGYVLIGNKSGHYTAYKTSKNVSTWTWSAAKTGSNGTFSENDPGTFKLTAHDAVILANEMENRITINEVPYFGLTSANALTDYVKGSNLEDYEYPTKGTTVASTDTPTTFYPEGGEAGSAGHNTNWIDGQITIDGSAPTSAFLAKIGYGAGSTPTTDTVNTKVTYAPVGSTVVVELNAQANVYVRDVDGTPIGGTKGVHTVPGTKQITLSVGTKNIVIEDTVTFNLKKLAFADGTKDFVSLSWQLIRESDGAVIEVLSDGTEDKDGITLPENSLIKAVVTIKKPGFTSGTGGTESKIAFVGAGGGSADADITAGNTGGCGTFDASDDKTFTFTTDTAVASNNNVVIDVTYKIKTSSTPNKTVTFTAGTPTG